MIDNTTADLHEGLLRRDPSAVEEFAAIQDRIAAALPTPADREHLYGYAAGVVDDLHDRAARDRTKETHIREARDALARASTWLEQAATALQKAHSEAENLSPEQPHPREIVITR